MLSCIKVAWQYLVPQRVFSQLMGKVANCQWPWLKNYLIHRFIKRYHVDMTQALESDYQRYSDFHHFFIRTLKPELRPLALGAQVIISPVDGTICQIGQIEAQTLLQAKGHSFSLSSLLAHEQDSVQLFENGTYAIFYLSPRDYHRVHVPLSSQLQRMVYVPGRLFSVNPLTTNTVLNLFSRNERVISYFDHPQGKMAVIMVGAMIVGSITTQWHGAVNAQRVSQIQTWDYKQPLAFAKGDEIGYFSLGSTVIVLLSEGMAEWDTVLQAGTSVQMGQRIAQLKI